MTDAVTDIRSAMANELKAEVQRGSSDAMVRMAEPTMQRNHNDDESISYPTTAAKAGDTNAMYDMAMFYYKTDNIDECKKWLKKAANLGDSECAEKLRLLGE